MVEKSALICESGLVSTTAEDEGVLGGQEVGVLTRKACLTLQRGRRKEQTAQREQQLCLTMQRRVFVQAVCLIVRKLQSQQGGGGGKDEVEQDKNNTSSSSDQGESMNVGRGEEEINREAEPEEEREEMDGERGKC